MDKWTIDDVAARFAEASDVSRRLPSARPQGYVTFWPTIIRKDDDLVANDDLPRLHSPPSPAAQERMLEACRWTLWLEEEQRHLIWMRADQHEWKTICRRFGCDRTTAWRRWQKALAKVALHLNLENAM